MNKKKIWVFVLAAGLFGVSSCSKFLNVNNNPNSVTTGTPDLVLPLAIVNTANFISNLNDYGSFTVGYAANAGGYGGFGSIWTYNYSTGDGIATNPWTNGYSTLESFQEVLNATAGSTDSTNYNAIAKIMQVYIFQNLVDWYNAIPFTQALQEYNNLTPKYDSGSAIYPALALMLDTAVNEINSAGAAAIPVSQTSDPLFGGNMTSWIQFANTLKLRLIVRGSGKCTFSNTNFYSAGFLTTDALVNPGYQLATNQENPSWNDWVVSYTGAKSRADYIAATFVAGYYNGTKLKDSARGAAIYFGYPSNTSFNQLGVMPPNNTLTSPQPGGDWYSGPDVGGTSLGNCVGIMKGPNMGEPLMLLAEADFLQAEADVRGILNQNAATDFNNGIQASFNYLYELPSGSIAAGYDPVADAATYITNNSGSYLANFSLATTEAQQIEAIITQKYIALNFIGGAEAWNEYRRTGYPVCSPAALNNPYGSFVSTQSNSTAPNKLPARVPYPNSEYTYNAANIPVTNIFSSKIFWAQ